MANYRNKHTVHQRRDWMCKGYKALGNSKKKWWSAFHYQPPKAARKAEAANEAIDRGGAAGAAG